MWTVRDEKLYHRRKRGSWHARENENLSHPWYVPTYIGNTSAYAHIIVPMVQSLIYLEIFFFHFLYLLFFRTRARVLPPVTRHVHREHQIASVRV